MLVFMETERMVLRQFTADDAERLVELDADPRVMRYITGGDATSRDEVEADILPVFLAAKPGERGTPPRAPVR